MTLLALLLLLACAAHVESSPWNEWAPGLDLGTFISDKGLLGPATITVLRVDPALWELGSWSAAGEGLTNGGTARRRAPTTRSLPSARATPGFRLPPFYIHDLDPGEPDLAAIRSGYRFAAQNLQLTQRPGVNRWGKKDKAWSEAALAEDAAGNAWFVFSRAPFTMAALNREPIARDAVAAQHLEGGPESQPHASQGGHALSGFGSHETRGFVSDDNDHAWVIPNVIGIRPR